MCVCVCVQVRLQARKHAAQNVAPNILNIVAVFYPVAVQVVLNPLPKLVTYAACLQVMDVWYLYKVSFEYSIHHFYCYTAIHAHESITICFDITFLLSKQTALLYSASCFPSSTWTQKLRAIVYTLQAFGAQLPMEKYVMQCTNQCEQCDSQEHTYNCSCEKPVERKVLLCDSFTAKEGENVTM